tara:strand:+ start:17686 stop:18906 length:1221 start_codon:yes stop_codon:yes gene_type:complete
MQTQPIDNKGMTKNTFLNRCIFIVSFFTFSGFYAILAITISLLGSSATRLITVPVRLLTTILMVSVIFYSYKKGKQFSKKEKIIKMLFFLFWSLYIIKLLWHHSQGYHLRLNWIEYLFYALNFCILPFFMYMSISFETYKKTILDALIFSGFLMGLTTLYLYKDIITSGIGRISLIIYQNPDMETLNPLMLSYASILGIMLCFYEILYNKSKTKWYTIYLWATIGLSVVMFLLGASRGSVLALFISILYLSYQADAKIKVRILGLILVLTPVLIWAVAASGSAVFERTSNSFDSGQTGRESLWMTAWNEFTNYPILGGRIEIGFYPHNIFIETLMATGILGFLILITILLKSLNRAIVLPKIDSNFIWVAIILIQGVCQHSFTGALYSSILVFFPMGLLYSKSKTD